MVINNDNVKGWPWEPWPRQVGTYPSWVTLSAVTSPQRPLAINSVNTARTRYWIKSFELVASPQGRCGKGNGTPLQYSCLENPMDGGAW